MELSELAELTQRLELTDDESELLHSRLEERGIDLLDDCGRSTEEQTEYRNGDLAETTTDALQLFFGEISKYPLLTTVRNEARAMFYKSQRVIGRLHGVAARPAPAPAE